MNAYLDIFRNGEIIRKCIGPPSCSDFLVCFGCVFVLFVFLSFFSFHGVCLVYILGRSSHILKLRPRLNYPYLHRIKENPKESALVKFQAFISRF